MVPLQLMAYGSKLLGRIFYIRIDQAYAFHRGNSKSCQPPSMHWKSELIGPEKSRHGIILFRKPKNKAETIEHRVQKRGGEIDGH